MDEKSKEKNAELMQQEIDEKLDELCDLAECWKRNRENGRTPNTIGYAITLLAKELSIKQTAKNRSLGFDG